MKYYQLTGKTTNELSLTALTGLPLRSLCPDSTLRLVATGCTADVKWSYTLKTTTGTLATTNDTLSLTYNTSLLAAWSAGDTLALTAACTLPNCGASQPSTTVKVVKKQSCATVNSDSSCLVYIKAINAINKETTTLTRVNGQLQPLTLSVVGSDSMPISNATYQWFFKNRLISNLPIINTDSIGKYKVIVSRNGANFCETFISLSATPCNPIPQEGVCGTTPSINIQGNCDNGPFLESLNIHDTFIAADYPIEVISITGGSVSTGWSGTGFIKLRLFDVLSNVEVQFNNIKLSTCYQLVCGKVETTYDPTAKNILEIDDISSTIKTTYADLQAFLNVFSGSPEDMKRLESFQNELVNAKTQIKTDAPNLVAIIDSTTYWLKELKNNPNACTNSSATPASSSTRNKRLSASVCPIDEINALSNQYNNESKNIPLKPCGSESSGHATPQDIELDPSDYPLNPTTLDKMYGNDPKKLKYLRLIQGKLAHQIIEWDYYLTRSVLGHKVYLERSIPRSSAKGKTGFADIVNETTGEIFEIKHVPGVDSGNVQVNRYVKFSNIHCPITPAWKRGTQYNAYANRRVFPWPFDPTKLLAAQLSINYPTGVIEYYFINKSGYQYQPVFLPVGVKEKVEEFVQKMRLQNLSPSLLEQETRRFLQENPNVVFYLQAALGVTAAVICVATVLEDIATLGAGLADDPASFALAYQLVKIAQSLPKITSPVGATGTRLILVTN